MLSCSYPVTLSLSLSPTSTQASINANKRHLTSTNPSPHSVTTPTTQAERNARVLRYLHDTADPVNARMQGSGPSPLTNQSNILPTLSTRGAFTRPGVDTLLGIGSQFDARHP